MDTATKSIEELGIDTARVLAADAVQKANSGHPGTAMALAPMGHVLWTQFLNYNPNLHHQPFVMEDKMEEGKKKFSPKSELQD